VPVSPQPRTLVILRHAKAEAAGPSDFERPLSESGRADAVVAGRWLADAHLLPDSALVSASLRTTTTWQALSQSAGCGIEASLDEALYAAGPESALDLIRAIDPAVSTLLVIGHNPTVSYLAQLLDDDRGDVEASNQMTTGFPTCALAVLRFTGEWADLDEAGASVVAFHVSRA